MASMITRAVATFAYESDSKVIVVGEATAFNGYKYFSASAGGSTIEEAIHKAIENVIKLVQLAPASGNGNSNGNGTNANEPPSEKQIDCIQNHCKWNKLDYAQTIKARFGYTPEELTKADARIFIAEIFAERDRKKAEKEAAKSEQAQAQQSAAQNPWANVKMTIEDVPF